MQEAYAYSQSIKLHIKQTLDVDSATEPHEKRLQTL